VVLCHVCLECKFVILHLLHGKLVCQTESVQGAGVLYESALKMTVGYCGRAAAGETRSPWNTRALWNFSIFHYNTYIARSHAGHD